MANGNGEMTPMLTMLKAIVENGEEVEPMTAIKLMLGVSWATYNASTHNGKEINKVKWAAWVAGAAAALSLVVIAAHVKAPNLLSGIFGVPLP